MPVRFLDLDPINQPTGKVRLNGRDYDVWPIKVGTVINLSVPAAPEGNGASFASQLEQTVAILSQLIPECPAAEFRALTLEQLNTLLNWARETAYGVAEKNSETPAETPAPETAASTPSTSPA